MVAVKRRSLSTPIILSSISVALSIALLVGWILVMWRNIAATKEVFQNTLLMVAGIISFVVIMTVLVLFTVFLVREILEVRRQVSFLDSVTHELKSPLASLRLCVETLARPELGACKRDEVQHMMAEDITRLSQVIDGILEAGRVAQGPASRRREPVQLANFVSRAVEVVRRRRKVDGLALDCSIPPDLQVLADPDRMRIVIENLIDNAVKYSGAEPELTIVARPDERGRLLLEISDRGIGIARRDLERIFERFYRAPEEAVRARYGTGLGLYVVDSIVRDMGGRIEARSGGPGMGTTIRVSLPRASARIVSAKRSDTDTEDSPARVAES